MCTQCVLNVYSMCTPVKPSARHDRRCDTMGTTAPPPPAESIMYISSHHLSVYRLDYLSLLSYPNQSIHLQPDTPIRYQLPNCLLLRLGHRLLPWVTIRYRLGYHGLPCRVTVGYRPVYQIYQIYQKSHLSVYQVYRARLIGQFDLTSVFCRRPPSHRRLQTHAPVLWVQTLRRASLPLGPRPPTIRAGIRISPYPLPYDNPDTCLLPQAPQPQAILPPPTIHFPKRSNHASARLGVR